MSIDELKEKVKNGVYEPDIYTSSNEDGEMLAVTVKSKYEFRVSTYQNNGWTRINDYVYDEGCWTMSETYEK